MKRGSCLALAGAALLALLPPSARAYSDLTTYQNMPAEGGGGGRWFTGSPADGFGCAVCHGETKAFAVGVSLPERYELNTTYEILVTWTAAAPHLSANVELTDAQGNGVGTVAIPGADAMTELDACEPYEARIPAVQLYPTDRGRTIVGLADCGGRQLRFQWTAPPIDVGPVFFSGGVVQSDDSLDLLGDAVARMHRPILSSSSGGYEEQTSGSCAVTGARAPRSAMLAWPLCVLALLGLRTTARAARDRSPARPGLASRGSATRRGAA